MSAFAGVATACGNTPADSAGVFTQSGPECAQRIDKGSNYPNAYNPVPASVAQSCDGDSLTSLRLRDDPGGDRSGGWLAEQALCAGHAIFQKVLHGGTSHDLPEAGGAGDAGLERLGGLLKCYYRQPA